MMVPIEKVFLRNQQLQKSPHNQTSSPFYKRVRNSGELKYDGANRKSISKKQKP